MPTGNYGIDVHIDTGATKWANDIAVMIENILQFLWTALAAVVRGVIVVLDWCYTIDLLRSPAMHRLTQSLQRAQATFTQPWLALVLVIASVLALYHGLIRRRVAETLGEALLMIAMMAGGLWVTMNPAGTIGALGAWANEASLGTLAAAAGHSPDHADRTLAESNQELFKAAIDAPWCFMEFGNVSWCEAHAEHRLEVAAKQLEEQARAGGEGGTSHGESAIHKTLKILTAPSAVTSKVGELVLGGSGEENAPHVSLQSATLLRGASSNGELFLAVPANGQARNSINDEPSLFRTLCGSSAEPCRGPTASEAEFRTQNAVWWRGIGLALVAFGLLGMLLLFGFIAWHLLLAAFMSLIYLLLAPAAVLLPALGEAGRSAFRTWVTHLLGAVASKLIYSFLLGALLMVTRLIAEVDLVGWFMQWLVLSSLWWIIYFRRHRLFDLAHGATQRGEHRSVVRRMGSALESRKGMATARWAKRKLAPPAPSVARRRHRLAQAGRERAKQIADGQVASGLEHRYRDASGLVGEGSAAQARISGKRARLGQMSSQMEAWLRKSAGANGARAAALQELGKRRGLSEREAELHKQGLSGQGDQEREKREAAFTRKGGRRERRMDHLRRVAEKRGAEVRSNHARVAVLQHRMNGLRAEIDRDQAELTGAKGLVKEGDRAKQATGKPYTPAQAVEFRRYLDEQAKLPHGQRDNAGMAGLVGLTRSEYERLGPPEQLRARAGIRRELAKRVALDDGVVERAASPGPGPSAIGRRDKRTASRELEGKVGDRARRPVDARDRGSSVMNDIHEVAARRKRQLGGNRL